MPSGLPVPTVAEAGGGSSRRQRSFSSPLSRLQRVAPSVAGGAVFTLLGTPVVPRLVPGIAGPPCAELGPIELEGPVPAFGGVVSTGLGAAGFACAKERFAKPSIIAAVKIFVAEVLMNVLRRKTGCAKAARYAPAPVTGSGPRSSRSDAADPSCRSTWTDAAARRSCRCSSRVKRRCGGRSGHGGLRRAR